RRRGGGGRRESSSKPLPDDGKLGTLSVCLSTDQLGGSKAEAVGRIRGILLLRGRNITINHANSHYTGTEQLNFEGRRRGMREQLKLDGRIETRDDVASLVPVAAISPRRRERDLLGKVPFDQAS